MKSEPSPFVRRLVAALGSGGIFLFFSEFFFVNEAPVSELLLLLQNPRMDLTWGLIEIWLYYALFAYGFLVTLSIFRVGNIWSLILTGALLGWSIEGVVVPAIYENIPFSLVWTAISWHLVIDLLVGWLALRWILEKTPPAITGAAAVALGLFWGWFATWTWNSESEALARILPEDFALFAFAASMFWIGGTFALNRWGGRHFAPSRTEIILVFGVMLLLAGTMAIPFLPLSLVIIPLITLTLVALWRARPKSKSEIIFEKFKGRQVPVSRYFLFLLTPAAAALTYPFYFSSGIGLRVEWVALPLVFAGATLYSLAVLKALVAKYPERST